MQGVPPLIPINHDDYHAKFIGRTAAGRQFFLTYPFVASVNPNFGREFLACYIFNVAGDLIEARIEDVGVRSEFDEERDKALRDSMLSELGEVTFCDIKVAPFRLERFGVEFGLIPDEPDEEGNIWWVTLEPGDYMAFCPPWTGEYDT